MCGGGGWDSRKKKKKKKKGTAKTTLFRLKLNLPYISKGVREVEDEHLLTERLRRMLGSSIYVRH